MKALIKAWLAALVLYAALAHADSISTAGTRILENPVNNGDVRVRVNVGGTKTDLLNVSATGTNARVGVNVTAPSAKLHVRRGAGGTVPSLATYQQEGVLIQGNASSGDVGALTIIGSNASGGQSRIDFGDNDSSTRGVIRYDHTTSPEKFSFNVGALSDAVTLDTNGLMTFSTSGQGLKLPTSGGTAATLDFYEEPADQTGSLAGSVGGATITSSAYTIKIVRVGRVVTLQFNASSSGNSGSGAFNRVYAQTAIPSRFRPGNAVYGAVKIDAGTATQGYQMRVEADGGVSVHRFDDNMTSETIPNSTTIDPLVISYIVP